MPLTDLTRISTSGIATGSTIDAPILRKDVDYRGSQVGVNTILFDSSENSLEFRDGAKATFGDSKDLEIYHSNTNSIINDSGTGNLQLQVGGSTKLETNPFGVVVTGILTATGFSGGVSAGVVTCTGLDVNGNGDVSGNFVVHGDLKLYHNGSHSFIDETGMGNLYIRNGTKNSIWCQTDGQVNLYHNDAKKFETAETGAVVTGILTATSFSGPILGSPINNPSGISTFYDLKVTNNLTVEGSTTTLDTVVTEVDKLEVSANNTTVGAAITQSGTGDILNLYDGSTEVFSVTDGGITKLTKGLQILPATNNLYSIDGTLSYYGTTNGVYLSGAGASGWLRLNASGVSNDRTAINLYGQNVGGFGDQIHIKTASGERIKIGSDGKVGINTTDTGHLITVLAQSASSIIARFKAVNKNSNFDIHTDASSHGQAYVRNNIGAIKVALNSNGISYFTGGDVGIGTETSETNFKLSVDGDLSLGEKNGTDNTYIDQKQNGDLHIINSGRGANGVSGNITGGAGGVGINRYNTIAGGTTYFRDFAVYNGKSTKVLMVDGSTSKVGIGTDTPARTLDVRGGTNGNANSRVLRLATADNGKRVDFSYERSGFLSINNGASDAALLLIGEDGDILIDRTSKLANAKLSINQDAGEEGIGLQLNTSSGITTAFTFYNSSGTNIGRISLKTDNDPDIVFKIKDSSGSPVEKIKFTSAGNVYQTGSSYTIDSAASAQFVLDRGNTSSGATVDLRTAGSTKWYFGMRGLVNDNFYIRNESGSTDPFTILPNGNVGINDISPSFNLEVGGSFAATTKSFIIDHPTKEKHKLRYACLEGPENSVYVRGKTSDSVIELPDYWTGLVHEDSITVNVTPIGNHKVWVESINNNSVTIGSDGSE